MRVFTKSPQTFYPDSVTMIVYSQVSRPERLVFEAGMVGLSDVEGQSHASVTASGVVEGGTTMANKYAHISRIFIFSTARPEFAQNTEK